MKNIYFKSAIGNFGDDLNGWLWPQIFNNIDVEDGSYFIGIGSILSKNIEEQYNIVGGEKVVFGTGVRPSLFFNKFELDNSWDIKFLRGPLSSMEFNGKYEHITDGAYALRQLDSFESLLNTEKKYEISLMPYFRSLNFFDWKSICRILGFHYISPCSEHGVEFTLKELAASKRIITEAMHGAIVADLLRVPWHRFTHSTYYNETPYVSEFKWADWLQSINIGYIQSSNIPLYTRNRVSKWIRELTNNRLSIDILKKKYVQELILEKLSKNDLKYYLSTDTIIKEIDLKIFDKVEQLKNNE